MSEHEFDFLSKMIKNMISYPKKTGNYVSLLENNSPLKDLGCVWYSQYMILRIIKKGPFFPFTQKFP